MADLISRQAAIALFIQKEERFADNHLITPKFAEAIARVLQKLPAVDAVEVVRCKDCTYLDKSYVNGRGFRICPASGMDITDMDFCSYGERRGENGKV